MERLPPSNNAMKTRLISATVILCLLMSVLFILPPVASLTLLMVVVYGLLFEIDRLFALKSIAATVSVVVGILLVYYPQWLDFFRDDFGVVPCFYILSVMLLRKDSFFTRDICFVAILFVLVKCADMSITLYQQDRLGLLMILLLVSLCDSGAYFFGKFFGRHKLAPGISPGKTWEGVAGGAITVFIALLLSEQFALLDHISATRLTVMTLSLTFLSVVGDLLQSKIKRTIGIKDSGQLIPGHGGLFDRLDSHLLVLATLHSLYWF